MELRHSPARIFLTSLFLLLGSSLIVPSITMAGDGPFADGWILETQSSSLTFQTVKNGSKLETSRFASFHGAIDAHGSAQIRVQLDSVDTKVDLRNVRLRFLLFETFRFKEAIVTAQINPATIAKLHTEHRLEVPLTFQLNLHGVTKTLQVDTIVTALAGNQVSVTSAAPLDIATALFGLDEGVKKLEEAAKVSILPMGSVSFNFVFSMRTNDSFVDAVDHMASVVPENTAIESTGDFNQQECAGRFEILSRTGAIYFRSGSAVLDAESVPILTSVIDIINRCPELNILVEGHTDSIGPENNNLRLSKLRAGSVLAYLIENSVDPSRLKSTGFGEMYPVAPNNSRRNRRLNRRIEFSVDS